MRCAAEDGDVGMLRHERGRPETTILDGACPNEAIEGTDRCEEHTWQTCRVCRGPAHGQDVCDGCIAEALRRSGWI